MPPRILFRLGLTLLGLCLAGAAQANDDTAAPARKPHPVRKAAPAAAPRQSLDQIRSDLFHGSAAQQDMERNDNDRVNRKPVDHTKDEFFSDWKGLK